jgi:hypothetical protein
MRFGRIIKSKKRKKKKLHKRKRDERNCIHRKMIKKWIELHTYLEINSK